MLVGVILFLTWLFWTIRTMVGPLVIAALLAYLLHPAVSFLEKNTPLQRRQTVVVVYLLFLIILTTTIVSLVPVVARQARSLAREIPTFLPEIEETIRPFEQFGVALPIDEYWQEIQAASNELFNPIGSSG